MDRIAATQIVRSSKLIAVEESEKIAIALKSMHENEHTQQRLSVGLHTLVKQTKGDMHVKKGARKFKTQRAYCDPDVGEAKSGMTPLHFATLMGRNDIVAVLVNEGNANASQKDTEREVAPIIVACEKGVLSIIRFLIEEARVSFDFTEYIERGISPVHLARDNGHGKCSRYLEYLQSQELSDMAERLKRASIGQRTFIRASDRHFNDSFTADIERLFGEHSTGLDYSGSKDMTRIGDEGSTSPARELASQRLTSALGFT